MLAMLLTTVVLTGGCVVYPEGHRHHRGHGEVIIESGHVHGPGCGHVLRGGVWITVP